MRSRRTTAKARGGVGARVRAARIERWWSRDSLAAQLGIGELELREIEEGRREADDQVARKMEAWLEEPEADEVDRVVSRLLQGLKE